MCCRIRLPAMAEGGRVTGEPYNLRNPYVASELPPVAPVARLSYPYPHKSVRWHDHPPHDGNCDDFDGWTSPWELRAPRYETLESQ